MPTDLTDYNKFLETKVDFILALQKEKNRQIFEITTQLSHIDKILEVFCISTTLPTFDKLLAILRITYVLHKDLYRWNSLLLLTYGSLCMEFTPTKAKEKLHEFRNELTDLISLED